MEVVKRELARQALDTIRVYNPMETTFSFMYDSYWHRVPAKSYMDMERFLARHYFKKICDYMIGQQIAVKGKELKAMREKQMGHEYTDHYQENLDVWEQTPKMNDPNLIEAIRKVVIIGVVKEYGAEAPEPQEQVTPSMDMRSLHEQIFDQIGKVDLPEDINQMPKEEPEIYVSKKERVRLAKEALNEDTKQD